MTQVCAILYTGGPKSRETLRALEAQTRPPDTLLLVGPPLEGAPADARRVDVPAQGGIAAAAHEGLRAGAETGADWLWLLDGRAIPEPGALAELLRPAGGLDGLPAPALLAGKVVDAAGNLHVDALPWPSIFEKEISTAACAHRLVSLRAARQGSLLVHRDVLERHGLPRADYVAWGEDLEWTARILQQEVGYLVPSSRSLRDEPPNLGAERRYRDVRNRVDMLRGPAWRREEKLWFGFLLLQDVAAHAREGAPTRRAALRGFRDGLLRARA